MSNHSQSQNNRSSFHESNIRLSSSFLLQNIVVKQKFPSCYKKQIWNEILKLKPIEFLFQQEEILNTLLNDEQKFNKFFRLFYYNHLKIYQWHILASEKHFEIKDYVFSKLLRKTVPQYKLVLKQNMNKNIKNTFKKQNDLYSPIFFQRSSNHSPKKSIFQQKKSQSLPNSIHQSAVYGHFQQKKVQDYHELFVKTLDACDGSKYIHYDFCKHQKGYQNRKLYNNFIRLKRSKKPNKKQTTFYQSLSGLYEGKQNQYQRSPSCNKTISFLQTGQNSRKNKLSRFEIMSFQNEICEGFNKNLQEKGKGNLHKTKSSRTLVLKKMPHQFGKPKPLLAFVIKVQKPQTASAIIRI